MIQLKRKQTYAIAAIAIGISLAFIVPAVNRIGKPKFEGKTAEEWLDYVESQLVQRGGSVPNTHVDYTPFEIKELTVALMSCGDDIKKDMIREYLYFKYPTGFKTNIYNLNDKLPPSVRSTRFAHPVIRWKLIGRALQEIQPSWDEVEPYIEPLKASADPLQLRCLTTLLGYTGEGATNAVPLLVQNLTQGYPNNVFALQSLAQLNNSAYPAVPALIEDVRSGRSTIRHMRIFAALGPRAANALPDLETLLDNPPTGIDSHYIAAAILSIDPNHMKALDHLDDYYANKAWVRKLDSHDWKHLNLITAPNKPVAAMVLKYMDKSESILAAAAYIHKFDPDIGLPILYKKLYDLDTTTDREVFRNHASLSFSPIDILLSSDPYDEVALKFLNKYLSSDSFSLFIVIQRNCYSDSPGVLDGLEKLEKNTARKQVLDSIQTTRRHIELNDKLRELKKNH